MAYYDKIEIEIKVYYNDDDFKKTHISTTSKDSSLGYTVGEAIRGIDPARLWLTLAHSIVDVLDSGCDTSTTEFWPGYNDAVNKMCIGAREVENGWLEHDEKFNSEDS